MAGAVSTSGTGIFTQSAAGIISGASTFTQGSSGTSTLAGANTFTGGVTLNSGTLKINSAGVAATSGPLGNGGTFTINGGTIDAVGFWGIVVLNVNPITVGGNFAFSTSGGTVDNSLTLPGAVGLGGATRTITTNGTGVLRLTGAVSNGGLTKDGSGKLALHGSNTYTGVTTINAGKLYVNILADGGTNSGIGTSSNAAANLVFGSPSATLLYTGSSNATTDRGFTLSSGAGGGATIESSGGGTLTIDNAVGIDYGPAGETRTLTLGGFNTGANTFTGLTTISAGTLRLGHATDTLAGAVTVIGGILDVDNPDTVGAVPLNSGSISGDSVLTANSYAVQRGTISAALAGAAALTKSTEYTVSLSGTNTYTGTTTISVGRLQFAKTASLYNSTTASWTAANIVVANTGTLGLSVGGTGEFTAGNVTTLLTNHGGANGTSTTGFASGSGIAFDTTNASGGTFTVADVRADSTGSGGGAISVSKLGTNTLALTGTNIYTGVTTIYNGTLRLGHATDTLAGAVTVNGGILDVDNPDTVGAVTLEYGTISGDSVLTATSYAVERGTISAALAGAAAMTKSDWGGQSDPLP